MGEICTDGAFEWEGFVPLPKSIMPSRISENADIYDFELSEDDMLSLETDEVRICSHSSLLGSGRFPACAEGTMLISRSVLALWLGSDYVGGLGGRGLVTEVVAPL